MKKWTAWVCLLLLVLAAGCGQRPAETAQNKWGVALTAENVTPTGLTIVCRQSGGENVAELLTGSFYVVQKREGTDWVDVQTECDVMWTMEAWVIRKGTSTSWEVNWEGLYAKLTAGEYRIGKEIMNSRGPGDYDKEMVYAEFAIP